MSTPLNRRQFLLFSAALLLTACGQTAQQQRIAKGSRVLALGDSLTFGYGAPEEAAYPKQLARLTGWRLTNGGVSGDTSAQALARLPNLLTEQPKLILLGIGGNDFLRKVPETETRANISTIVQTAQKANIPIVLIGVPRPSLGALIGSLSDHPLYQDLAEQHQIPLLSNAWSKILSDSSLRSDQIHANAEGYLKFAEIMADFLKEQGFI